MTDANVLAVLEDAVRASALVPPGGGGLVADAVCPKCDHSFEVTLDPVVEA